MNSYRTARRKKRCSYSVQWKTCKNAAALPCYQFVLIEYSIVGVAGY